MRPWASTDRRYLARSKLIEHHEYRARSIGNLQNHSSTLLLLLSSIFILLSIFDHIAISSIPFARTLSSLFGLLLTGLFIWSRRSSFRIHRGPQLFAFCFVLLMIVHEIWRVLAGEPTQVFHLMQWVQILILFIIFVELSRDPRALVFIWMAVVVAVLFMAVSHIFNIPGMSVEHESGRAGFAGVNFNRQAYWYAMAIVTVLLIVIEMWRRMGLLVLALFLAALAILCYALLSTGSRGGLLSLVSGLAVLLTLSFKKRNQLAYFIILPPLLLGGLATVFISGLAVDRLSAVVEGEEDGGRLVIWEAASDMLFDRPLTGYGPRFQEDLGGLTRPGRVINTHNSFLQPALAFGLPGFVLWAALVGAVFLRAWSNRRYAVGALFCSLIVCSMVSGLVGDLGFNRFFWVMLSVAANVALMQGALRVGSGKLLEELGFYRSRCQR